MAPVTLYVVSANNEMPDYLTEFVGDMTSANWNEIALRYARTCLEESITISEEISKPSTLFSARVTLARVEAAEGKADTAMQRLAGMLTDATGDEARAELHYWQWQLLRDSSDTQVVQDQSTIQEHASTSLRLYESLLITTPSHEYRQRVAELKEEIPMNIPSHESPPLAPVGGDPH